LTFPLFLFKLFMGLAEEGDQMKKDSDVEKVVRYTIRLDGKQTSEVKIKVHQLTKGDVDNPDEQVCTPLNTSPPRIQTGEPASEKPALPSTEEKKNTSTRGSNNKANVSSEEKKNRSPESKVGKLKSKLYKTELCRSWRYAGSCRYLAKCKFAHGIPELRPVQRSKKYKTQLCNKWNTFGYCPYGDRCQFLHGIPVGLPNMPPPFTPPRKMPLQILQTAPMMPYMPVNTTSQQLSIPFLLSSSIQSPPQFTTVGKPRMKNCMVTSPPMLSVNPIAPAEADTEYQLHLNTAAEVAHSTYDEIKDIDTQIESLEDAKLKILLAKTQTIMHQAILSPTNTRSSEKTSISLATDQLDLKAKPQLLTLAQNGLYRAQEYEAGKAQRETILTISEGKRYAANFVPREE